MCTDSIPVRFSEPCGRFSIPTENRLDTICVNIGICYAADLFGGGGRLLIFKRCLQLFKRYFYSTVWKENVNLNPVKLLKVASYMFIE